MHMKYACNMYIFVHIQCIWWEFPKQHSVTCLYCQLPRPSNVVLVHVHVYTCTCYILNIYTCTLPRASNVVLHVFCTCIYMRSCNRHFTCFYCTEVLGNMCIHECTTLNRIMLIFSCSLHALCGDDVSGSCLPSHIYSQSKSCMWQWVVTEYRAMVVMVSYSGIQCYCFLVGECFQQYQLCTASDAHYIHVHVVQCLQRHVILPSVPTMLMSIV